MRSRANTPNLTVVVVFDIQQEVDEVSKGEEADGKLHKQYVEDKLMNSVLEGDKDAIDHAEMMQEATNMNIGAFTPSLLFSQMVKNFSVTKQLLGEKLIRLLSGYNPEYIEKNLKIPEFRKELQQNIKQNVETMKDDGLLDKEGAITNKGVELGAILLVKELDKFITKDKVGEKVNKQTKQYGEKVGSRPYRSGDRYKDINIRRTVRQAIKRGHKSLKGTDLVISEREGKGKVSILFALDASSSMKGKKLETCKKAGIALAYRAIQDKDDVGLVVFGSEIICSIPPTQDFSLLLNAMSGIKASKQTDFAAMIIKCIELFPVGSETKHLIILTDAMPTVGKEPELETLHAVSTARSAGITISLTGVKLEKSAISLAKEITKIGEGRFNMVKNLDAVGQIVLEDYYAIR